MSDLTTLHTANDAPSRELDARVAEALGWRRWDTWRDQGHTRPVTMWIPPPLWKQQHATERLARYTTDPDDLGPLEEMLAWLHARDYCVPMRSFSNGAAEAHAYEQHGGAVLESFGGRSLKHAVALLVLEVARREREARDD